MESKHKDDRDYVNASERPNNDNESLTDAQAALREFRKKLPRRSSEPILGGVIAGYAEHFQLNVWLLRLIVFSIVFFGSIIGGWEFLLLYGVFFLLMKEPIKKTSIADHVGLRFFNAVVMKIRQFGDNITP